MMSEDKFHNPSADRVPVKDVQCGWVLKKDFDELRERLAKLPHRRKRKADFTFKRMICQCGSTTFSVLGTADYETSVNCTACSRWYIVHSG